MGVVVDFGQVVEIEFGIDLRGGQIAVPEQGLYGTDVLCGLQKMAGIAVAQHVRGEMLRAVLADGPVAQALLDLALPQAFAEAVGKQCGLACRGMALRQIVAQSAYGLVAERYLSLFVAFAGYAHPAVLQYNVVQVEGVYFTQTQAAAVHQLKNSMVAQGEGVVGAGIVLVEQVVE